MIWAAPRQSHCRIFRETATTMHYVMVNAKNSILRVLDGMNMSGQGGPGHTGGGVFTMQINNAGEVFSSPAVYKDPATGTVWLLIPGTKGFTGLVYSLDANHNPTVTQKWQITGGWSSSAVVANGIMFWANGGGLSPTATSTLFATDVKTGAQLWSAPHGTHHWSKTKPKWISSFWMWRCPG